MSKLNFELIDSRIYKVIIIISSIVYSLWGPFMQSLSPNHIDSFMWRFSIAMPLIFLVLISFLIPLIDRNLKNIFYVFATLSITQYFYLLKINNLDDTYIAGSVVFLFAVNTVIESVKFKSFLAILSLTFSIYLSFNNSTFDSSSSLLLVSISTVVFMSFVTQYLFMKIQKMLEKEVSENSNLKKWSSLGQMAGGVAHEINSPLTTIYLRLDNLQDLFNEHKLPALFHDEVHKIKSDSERISSIMKSLRLLTKEGAKYEKDPLPLHKVCLDVMDRYKESFEKNNIQVLFKTEVKERPMALGNAQAISQVLDNLVKNAMDAIQHLSLKWIHITLSESEAEFVIYVQDSGRGIPKEVQDRIFEPFFSTKEIGKGMGIGLSLCRQIAKAHDGTLIVDNTKSNTTFKLSIPKSKSSDLKKVA